MAAAGTLAGASEAAVRTLAKLDQVLPARLRSEVRALFDSIAAVGWGGTGPVESETLMTLARATRDELKVEFGYTDKAGAPTRRRVEPYHLVTAGDRWYLMAYDLDRDDWRTFRLDRLSEIRVGTLRFRRREHPDPADFVRQALTRNAVEAVRGARQS